ncbi:MAG: radical SAM protein [Limisphaerales bacterium]
MTPLADNFQRARALCSESFARTSHAEVPFPSPDGTPRVPASIPPRSALARERHPLALQSLAPCHLCLHRCGVDRTTGPAGRCHAGPNARCFSAQTDVSDELELLPSFAISLSGCNLRCDFCITGGPSWNPAAGSDVSPHDLASHVRAAFHRGARTVMILGGEPTIHLPALLELVAALPDNVPIVLKTNACFSEAARPLLFGLFDVWLPDLKFGNPDCAQRLAGIPRSNHPAGIQPESKPTAPESPGSTDYWATVTSNLIWMAGEGNGADLIVRHLLMPGHIECCWAPAARWLSRELPRVKVSLRDGYWPTWHAARHPEFRAPLPRAERDRAMSLAREHRLHLVP